MKLNVGSGNVPLKGYVNIDKYYYPGSPYPLTDQSQVEKWEDNFTQKWIYGDAVKLDFESDIFDKVILVHVLEHLDMAQGSQAIMEAHRVLKQGGILEIELPDLLVACDLMKKVHVTPLGDNQPWHRVMGLLYGTDGADGEGQYHMCGYTKEYLKFKLDERGFHEIHEIPVGFGHGNDLEGHAEPQYDFRMRATK
jgi:predicted SAM-dependent methyltransferase